jgi:uroporphyrinogen decarboxylase
VPQLIDLTYDAWRAIAPRAAADSLEAFLDNDLVDVCPPWWSFDFSLRQADWLDSHPPASELPVMDVGSWQAFADRLKALRDAGDEKYLLVRLYGIHFEQGVFARGFGNFVMDMIDSPQFAREFLRECVQRNLAHMRRFLPFDEIDGVLLGSDWGSQNGLLLSAEMFHDFIRPGEQRMIDAIHAAGKDVWLHSCGDVCELIPTFVEMGYDVLNPLEPECMDLADIKRQFGGELCLWGGISTKRALLSGTPEEVRAEARRVRDTLGAGGGYIFAATQYIPPDLPPENVIALLDIAREGR